MTGILLPKLFGYDPVTSAENAPEPFGHVITDSLAVRLVPGNRQCMSTITRYQLIPIEMSSHTIVKKMSYPIEFK